MNNFLMNLKRFFTNKNTITVIGVIVVVGLLYAAYSYQIGTQVNPIKIPVASVDIQPRTLITEDMVKYITVPKATVTTGAYTNSHLIVGKYSNYNTMIPAGSMFFQSTLVDFEDLPDSAFVDVKDGEIPYQFAVNMESTFGNSVYPGNKIDLYMKAVNDETGKLVLGKFLQDIEVLAVKDSSGRHVFENSQENRTPAYIIFGVSEEVHLLLRKAEYLREYSVELILVPHGGTVESEGTLTVSSQWLKNFIDTKTENLPELEETVPSDEYIYPEVGE